MHGALWHRAGPESPQWPRASEPSKAAPLGDAELEPVGIYLGNTATDRIEEALASSPEAPVAGLLAGYPLYGPRRPFILVTHALPIDFPLNEDGEPEFSSDAFADAYPAFAELGGDVCVVGWFSARPRNAAGMSPFERYAHRRHFPEKWQVAFLIDSTRRTSRLYRWDEDRLVACDQFYFWNCASEPVEGLFAAEEAPEPAVLTYDDARFDEAAVAVDTHVREDEKRRAFIPWLLAAALVVLIYLLIPNAPGSIFWLRARQADEATGLSRLQQDLAVLELEAERLESLRIQALAEPRVGDEPVDANPAELGQVALSDAQPVSSDPVHEAGQSAPAAAASTAAPQPLRDPADRADYVIQPGDTMWSISSILLGDPWGFRALAEENEIADPDVIFPGQRLRVPGDSQQEQ